MSKLTKERRDELELDLSRLKEVDRALHMSHPVGGNANHERAQNLVSDRIREITEALK